MKLALCLLLSLLSFSRAVVAEIHALVIGIDHYAKPIKSLHGGVNDANMVAAALRRLGAKDVRLLTDQLATRENLEKAWQTIVSQAKQDDIVFFTYAGHGAQHPERVKGTEADGQDEFYVLSKFSKTGKNTQERIDDDDLQVWFSKVPHLKIVLVSDSCHSGTMTRSYKTSKLNYRSTEIGALTHDALPVIDDPTLVDERKTPLHHVLSYSGVPDNSLVPEILIEDAPHGALSWYLSKGLTGDADLNHDNRIQTDELKTFLEAKIPQETDGQQHPVIALPSLISFASNAANSIVKMSSHPIVPFAITGASTRTAEVNQFKKQLHNTRFTKSEAAVLTFDPENQRLQNKFGDTVYSLAKETNTSGNQKAKISDSTPRISTEQLQLIINKYGFIENIKKLSNGTLHLHLQPNDTLHRQGEILSLLIENFSQPYFTFFNIASDGTLNFLYPQARDAATLPLNRSYRLPLKVTPPFGADHFIAITSQKPLTDLHAKLQALDAQKGDFDLLFRTIEQLIKDRNPYQIGIYSTYTQP